MDLGLSGKTVIVTGSSGGLGRGLVLAFVEEGCNVVLADPDAAQGERIAEQLGARRDQVLVLGTDVTQPNAVDELVVRTLDHFSRIDVLVNNAGGGSQPQSFIDKELAEMHREIELNVWGVVHCTRAVGTHLLDQGSGAIVNIASNAAVLGEAAVQVENYGGAKGYVIALSRGLANSWGPQGVRVNCIAPGWIVPHAEDHVGKGSFWPRFGYEAFGSLAELETQAERGALPSVQDQPIRKLGRPEDIANLTLFLASDRVAGHVTGQLISVSGGAYMP